MIVYFEGPSGDTTGMNVSGWEADDVIECALDLFRWSDEWPAARVIRNALRDAGFLADGDVAP